MADHGSDPDATDEATHAVAADDAQAGHVADRPPTEAETEAAGRAGEDVPETVANAYEEAAKTGAQVKGEGQI